MTLELVIAFIAGNMSGAAGATLLPRFIARLQPPLKADAASSLAAQMRQEAADMLDMAKLADMLGRDADQSDIIDSMTPSVRKRWDKFNE